MRLKSTTSLIFAALVLSGCGSLQRENLSLGVTGPTKTTSLAYRSNPAFGGALSRREWGRLARAETRALDFVVGGQSLDWGQPSGRARGSVEVSQPFAIAKRECRRFKHAIVVRGTSESVTGVACREVQGPWTLVS